MRKRIFSISFLVAILILLIFSAGCFNNCSGYFSSCFTDRDTRLRNVLKEEYDIELSQDDEILFERECSFGGDGEIYFVIQFAEEPSEILNEKKFYTNKFATGTEDERTKILDRMKKIIYLAIKGEGVLDDKYKPDWGGNFLVAGACTNFKSHYINGTSYYYNLDTRILIIATLWQH